MYSFLFCTCCFIAEKQFGFAVAVLWTKKKNHLMKSMTSLERLSNLLTFQLSAGAELIINTSVCSRGAVRLSIPADSFKGEL